MRKIYFVCGLLAVLASFAVSAQPGRYVRKQLKPQFFIPEKDLSPREKLPEFNYYPDQPRAAPVVVSEEKTQPETPDKSLAETTPTVPETSVAATEKLPDKTEEPKLATVDESTESSFNNYDKNELATLPEYKQKYADYVNDLKIIAETGKTPDNPRLTEDLAVMNSNERIPVDENFGLSLQAAPAEQLPEKEIPVSDNVIDNEVNLGEEKP